MKNNPVLRKYLFMTFMLSGMVLFFSACRTSKESVRNQPALLKERYWVLESIESESIPQGSVTPYIAFDTNGRYHGNFGCNNFFGSYYAGKKKITLDYAGATKMLCGDMRTEKAFQNALKRGISHYRIEHNTLYLIEDKKDIMVFRATDSIPGRR